MAEAAAWYAERVSGLASVSWAKPKRASPASRGTANRCTLESSSFARWRPAHVPAVISAFGSLHCLAKTRRRCTCACSPPARILGEAVGRDLEVARFRLLMSQMLGLHAADETITNRGQDHARVEGVGYWASWRMGCGGSDEPNCGTADAALPSRQGAQRCRCDITKPCN